MQTRWHRRIRLVPGSITLGWFRSALHALENYRERKTREIQNAESILRNYEGLNYRQLAFLSLALRKPDASFSVSSQRTSHQVAYATGRSDLLHLADQGLLIKRMRGGSMYLEPGSALIDIMRR